MDLQGVADHDPVAVTDGAREAAVLAPVVDRPDGEHLLFIKRADHLGEHPGQMSFPGGGCEPEDGDLAGTATREAREEVGLPPAAVEVVGRLDDIRTVTDYAVRPFVGRVPDRPYEPADDEVAETAVLPLSALTDPDNYDSERRDHPRHGEIRVHYFRAGGYTVWGATGRMLVQLLELATDWQVPAEPDRVVDADADFPI